MSQKNNTFRHAQLLQRAQEERETLDGARGPMLVHCSAGIGRTGTLLVIDQCLRAVTHLRHQVDLTSLIARAREDRMGLVQHTGCGRAALAAAPV